MRYLKTTYDSVHKTQISAREKQEVKMQDEGTLGMELQVGDAVMLRLEPTVKREGSKRFQPKVRDGLWEISAKVSPHTFWLVAHGGRSILYEGTVNAEN